MREIKKKYIVAAAAIAALLAFIFLLKPLMRRNDATKVVKSVLIHWKNGDLALAMPHWESEFSSPPVYGLTYYKIKKGEVSKKDGVLYAQVPVTLDFSEDNTLPSGKNWIFKLKKTRYGWKVSDFRLSESEKP